MKNVRLFVTIAIVAALAVGVLATLAQQKAPAKHQHDATMKHEEPQYNPATEVTLKGTVLEVKEHECKDGQCAMMGGKGLHLMVKTGKGTHEAHLGPASYTAGQKFSFAKGDEVEVTGSMVKHEGVDALLAREVKKGGQTLTLRDAKGMPKWPHKM